MCQNSFAESFSPMEKISITACLQTGANSPTAVVFPFQYVSVRLTERLMC